MLLYLLSCLVVQVTPFHALRVSSARRSPLHTLRESSARRSSLTATGTAKEPTLESRNDSRVDGISEWAAAGVIAGTAGALRGFGMVDKNDTRSDVDIVASKSGQGFMYAGGASVAVKVAAGVAAKGVRHRAAHFNATSTALTQQYLCGTGFLSRRLSLSCMQAVIAVTAPAIKVASFGLGILQLGIEKYRADRRAYLYKNASAMATEKEVQAAVAQAEADRMQLSGARDATQRYCFASQGYRKPDRTDTRCLFACMLTPCFLHRPHLPRVSRTSRRSRERNGPSDLSPPNLLQPGSHLTHGPQAASRGRDGGWGRNRGVSPREAHVEDGGDRRLCTIGLARC